MTRRAAVLVAFLALSCGGRTSYSGGSGSNVSGGGAASGAAAGSAGLANGGSAAIESGDSVGVGGSGYPSYSQSGVGGPCGAGHDWASPGVGCLGALGCQAGVCGYCPSGMDVCDGLYSFLPLPVCVNEQTDPNNCGGCAIPCPVSAPSCQNGNCVPNVDASADGMAGAGSGQNALCPCGAPSCGPCFDEGGTAAPMPLSCAPGGPGMTNCGPGGSGTESCCTSLEVTGGTYYRTYTNLGSGPTGEADLATVSSFRLDKYDVTVGRFRQFVNAWKAGWLPMVGSGKHAHVNGGLGLFDVADDAGVVYEPGWTSSDDVNIGTTVVDAACGIPTFTASASANENLPINCITWATAYAFCIWDTGFLPSEAEWEYAAAGGSQQREYPWGPNAPGPQYANYCSYQPDAGDCSGPGSITPVGAALLGAGLWGQLDLAGNVAQWTLDSYAAYVSPCVDCAYMNIGSLSRVPRGGGYDAWPSFLSDRVSGRDSEYANTQSTGIGLRCARTP